MHAIEIKNLTLRVPAKTLLREFSVNILSGEFIGLFGANGSGKTSLIKAILGLFPYKEGKIFIEKNIGYMPQLREHLTSNLLCGWEYILSSVNGTRWGFAFLSKKQKNEIREIVNLVEAENYIHRPYRYLSGGERQRISFAQALIGSPKILLLDEPLSGLDPGQQEKMLKLISRIQKQLNMTILLTAHDFNPLLNYMSRLIYLGKGKAAVGTVDEVVTSEKLSWIYDAPIEVFKHQNRLFVMHRTSGINLYESSHLHHS